jgi:hypothetical protein
MGALGAVGLRASNVCLQSASAYVLLGRRVDEPAEISLLVDGP